MEKRNGSYSHFCSDVGTKGLVTDISWLHTSANHSFVLFLWVKIKMFFFLSCYISKHWLFFTCVSFSMPRCVSCFCILSLSAFPSAKEEKIDPLCQSRTLPVHPTPGRRRRRRRTVMGDPRRHRCRVLLVPSHKRARGHASPDMTGKGSKGLG